MLIVKNLTKSFGVQTLFENASFTIGNGEKIGLVGRNGHGKSTFIKIVTGHEEADQGEIEFPTGYTIQTVDQHISFTQKTALLEAALGLESEDEQWKAEKILSGLGFTENDMAKDPLQFSGGFQVRINLAKVLLTEPNLLLLDEPTNYLDITSIRWLTQFLKNWPGELLLITHDRSFMDSVITHTIAIHRQQMKKMPGNTEKMYQQIIKEEEIVEKTRVNDEKKRKEVEIFIDRYRSKARIATRVQSRIKMLDKMGKSEKLATIAELDFSFNEYPFQAKTLMSADTISFGYDHTLFSKLSVSIEKGDRICIIGKNGKGKTTLLKLLAGALNPLEGEIHQHQHTKIGYFEQTNISTLDPNRTVEQEIAASTEGETAQLARNIAGAMMFKGDDALKKISVLSGGEKARVMLGKLVIQPANLLLLDEPTNHFDIQSCDSLIESLDMYNGAVVMVTHNELFLRALAQKLIIFTSQGVQIFDGSYDEFLDKIGWEDEENLKTQSSENQSPSLNPKEMRKLRSEIIRERSELLKPLEEKIAHIEELIVKSEEDQKTIQNQLIDASAGTLKTGGMNIEELSIESHRITTLLETSFEELETISLKHSYLKNDFEKRLENL